MKNYDRTESAETLGLHEAASFVRLHYQTLRERAKNGEIPGACKPGKQWVFLRTGLIQYLENLSPCRSTKLGALTILTYPQREAAFAAALGLPTRHKRRTPPGGSRAR